jgi:hypothetical protein
MGVPLKLGYAWMNAHLPFFDVKIPYHQIAAFSLTLDLCWFIALHVLVH